MRLLMRLGMLELGILKDIRERREKAERCHLDETLPKHKHFCCRRSGRTQSNQLEKLRGTEFVT
jgi:hypothetical protein